MKKNVNIIILILTVIIIILFIGLLFVFSESREKLKYEGKNFNVIFNVKKALNYKVSTESGDFENVREDAVIFNKNIIIGIEEDNSLSLDKYKKDFDLYTKKYEKEKDFKKITYSNMKGFQKYYGGYKRYEVYLKTGSNDACLKLNIYSKKNTLESTKKVLESKEVQDILNNIKVELK